MYTSVDGWLTHPAKDSTIINVSPFIAKLVTIDAPPNSAPGAGAREILMRTIRLLNTTVIDPGLHPPVEVANLYADLYQLADAFEMIETRPAPVEGAPRQKVIGDQLNPYA